MSHYQFFQDQTTLLLTCPSKQLFSTSENIPSARVTVNLAQQDPETLRLGTFWKVEGGGQGEEYFGKDPK